MGAAALAAFCAVLVVVLGFKGVEAYLASPAPWSSAGHAALGVIALFGLWWLFGAAAATGLDLARKTVERLEEEAVGRNRVLSLAWTLFAATVVLAFVLLMAGAL